MDLFFVVHLVGRVGYGDGWGVGWVLTWYVYRRPSRTDFFLYLTGNGFLQDAEGGAKLTNHGRRPLVRRRRSLGWFCGSPPQSTADPSGTDAPASAFARGGRSLRDAALADSRKRQVTPFPTNTLVPGRPHLFGRLCNLPPHLAFRITNIIMRDSSTRIPVLIYFHTRFHPQIIPPGQCPTESRPSRHFVRSAFFVHSRSSLSTFIQSASTVHILRGLLLGSLSTGAPPSPVSRFDKSTSLFSSFRT